VDGVERDIRRRERPAGERRQRPIPVTANQFVIAMLLNIEDIDIGEARYLSFNYNIIREVSSDSYPLLLNGHPEFEN
jgi:hypothetical protein